MLKRSIHRNREHQRGITRREILLILIIVSVLGVVLGELLGRRLDDARQEQVRNELERLANALHQYKLDNKRYPTTRQGLGALVKPPGDSPLAPQWDGPYLSRESLLRDPWGNPYNYTSTYAPPAFEVSSRGADGKPGGEDSDADTFFRYQSADGGK